MPPEKARTEGVTALLLGPGVSDEIVVRIRLALATSFPEVTVVSDPRLVRDQLRHHLAALQADDGDVQERSADPVIARLEEHADRLDQARRRGDKERFEDLFERAPAGVGIHELNDQKVITRVNEGEVRLLGYTRRDQIVGRQAWEFIVMQEASQRAMDKKMSGQVELKPFLRTFTGADGRPVRMVVVDRHILDSRGNVVGICSVIGPAGPAADRDSSA